MFAVLSSASRSRCRAGGLSRSVSSRGALGDGLGDSGYLGGVALGSFRRNIRLDLGHLVERGYGYRCGALQYEANGSEVESSTGCCDVYVGSQKCRMHCQSRSLYPLAQRLDQVWTERYVYIARNTIRDDVSA